jgi:drug/metabolite transporter (DMT)-like permease
MLNLEIGALSGILSGLLFSICNLIIKKKLNSVSNLVILLFVNLSSGILFLSMYLFRFSALPVIPTGFNTLTYVFTGAILGSLLGLLFFYKSIELIPFYKANLYRSVSPLLSFSIGFLFFPIGLTSINKLGLMVLLISFVGYGVFKSLKSERQSSKRLNRLILNAKL